MSMSAQTMQQSLPDSGGGIGGSLTAHPMLIAALVGGAVGLFVLLRKSGGSASAPSSDASVGNVQIASLQDQLLRFSGEQSLRDQATQNAITGLGDSVASQITGLGTSLWNQAQYNSLANTVEQQGLATYLQHLIVAYGGSYAGTTQEQKDAYVNSYKQDFAKMLASNDAMYEASDGSTYRTWLAIRNQMDPTRQQNITAFV